MVELNFQYQEDDLNYFLEINDRNNRSFYGIVSGLVLLISFLLISQMTANPIWVSAIISVLITLIFWWYYRKTIHDLVIKDFKQNPKLLGNQQVIISASGIRKIDQVSDCYYEYSLFKQVWEHAQGFFLELPRKTYVILPKRAFSSEEQYDQLKKDLKAKINNNQPAKRKSVSNLKKGLLLFGIVFLLLIFMGLVSCFGGTFGIGDTVKDFNSALETIEDEPNNEIIAYDKLDQGALVFYQETVEHEDQEGESDHQENSDSMLRMTFLPQKNNSWGVYRSSSGYTRNDTVDIQGNYALDRPAGQGQEAPYPIVYGEIINPDIEQVLLSEKNGSDDKKEAQILTGDQLTIWYALVDEATDLEVVGLDSQSKEVASTTISKGTMGLISIITVVFRKIYTAGRIANFVLIFVAFWGVMVVFRQFIKEG